MNITDFPQLEEITDTIILAQTLQQHLGAAFATADFQVAHCRIRRVYYKPGRNGHCRLHFQATIGTADQREITKQMFFAQLFPPGQVQQRFATISGRDLVQPQFGTAVTLIPHWEMILWAYPNDPRLIGLPLLTDADKLLAIMQATPHRFGLPAAKQAVAVNGRLTKYVPGLRCGYLYTVTLNNHGSEQEDYNVFAKAYRPQNGPAVYATLQQIWTQAARQGLPLQLPQPYSYDETNHILWQQALPGRPLSKMAISNKLPDIVAQIGEHLAMFHNLELYLPTGLQLADQVADLTKSIKAIKQTFPAEADRCHVIHKRLMNAAAKLGTVAATPVHGSFKFSHIFLNNGRIAFIDFDGATCGDPAYDLGRFIAYLHKMQAAGKIPAPLVEQSIDNFCAAYQETAKNPVSQTRIKWYTTSLLVSSHVYKAVKRKKPAYIAELLRLAEHMDFGLLT